MKPVSLLMAFALVLGACARPSDFGVKARHQAQVDSLMQQLSIREKVAQLFIMRGPIHPFVDRTLVLDKAGK